MELQTTIKATHRHQNKTSNDVPHEHSFSAKLIAYVLSSLLIWNPILVLAGGIMADTNAPKTQQATILNTSNGIPQINIQTPSTAGVSRNAYSQLDVSQQGAIFNNSRTNVQTQLGGWIQANSWLASGSARIILNEVNSTAPSQLNGYMEVAGQRAQLVIVNPAGIQCDGCGFINTNRATLSTGSTIINNGNLEGYLVQRGTVSINGNGLDASQTDYTDIMARAVEVNAGIWANELNISTGTNQSDASHASVKPIATSEPAPTFAIDVASLGGMYAGKIRLIGTESGLGVRNVGSIDTSVGNLTLTADGRLENTGTITSKTNLTINTDTINNSGTLYAQGNTDIDTQGNINNSGIIAALTNTTLNATGSNSKINSSINGILAAGLETDGTLADSGNLAISATQSVAAFGQNLAAGEQAITSQTLDLSNSQTTGQNLTLIASNGQINASGSTLIANGTLIANTTQTLTTDEASISAEQVKLTADTLTNRGIINGSDTFIDTITLNNIGTGRIYGDHIAINTTTLINDVEGGTAAVIAARDRLDIGAETITNHEHALLFSAGDMAIGGSLDANHLAVGQGDTLNNNSATVEALANLEINVATLYNTNDHFSLTTQLSSNETFSGWDWGRWCSNQYSMPGCTGNWVEDYTVHNYTRTIVNPIVAHSDPAKILAGGDIALLGNNLTNDKSQIIAGGTLSGDLVNLNNIGAQGTQTTTLRDQYSVFQKFEGWIAASTNNITITATITLPVTEVHSNTVPTGTGTQVTTLTTGSDSQTVIDAENSLYHSSTNPESHYLIETDAAFANYKAWLSSDYLLTQLQFDPATMQKRLGDGFYEQKLVREQVAQLTGRRFLEGFASDEVEYQALMSNGVTVAQQWDLIPGIALTEAQVNQLTSDIVWLVEKTVTLTDGSTQQVLVPQVYVRPKQGDLDGTGTLLSGNNVNLQLAGDLSNNNATIAGRSAAVLTADNIHNLNGHIAGNSTVLTAQTDLNNLGGIISGKDTLSITAGHDINIETTTSTAANVEGGKRFSRTTVDRTAGLYVSNPNGLLVANAGNNLNLLAAEVSNNGTNGQTLLAAGNDLNLGTVTTAKINSQVWDARTYSHRNSTREVGTTIQTTGDLTLSAQHDLTAMAANVSSDAGSISAVAGHDLTIASGTATRNEDTARYEKKSGFLSSSSKNSRVTLDETTAISSSFSGDNVSLTANNNLNVQGSQVVSTQNTALSAGGNITIEAVQQSHEGTHFYDKKRSGLMSSGGVGITIGSRQLTNTSDIQQITNVGSTIGSVEGDVNITSGKIYTQTGSDVLTPQGDINITAQQANIIAAQDSYANQQTTKFKQSGLTLAITSPVISAIQTAQQMANASNNTKDSRMQALAAGTAALSVNNAYDATNTALNAAPSGDAMTDAGNSAGGVNLSLSIGSSKSKSSTTQTSSNTVSSHLTAGGDITISATGAGQDSDINVIGSQIKASGDVSLKADDQIKLLAAQNIDTLNSKNKGSSASIGVSVGTGGLLVTASASGSKGKAIGNGTTWTETQIQSGNEAGDKVTLESGTDTTLKGAQLIGNQAIANVGTSGQGDLNIQSLQDSDQYDAKQKSMGGSISVGYGKVGGSVNYSSSKTDSNYASVNEQAGIFSGDEGFQVNVNGNTNLIGAVIASTDKAIQDNKNSLTTDTFTTSNIENQAEYDAKGMSASVGAGTQSGKPTISGAGVGMESDAASSTTLSGISGASIIITDEAKQQALISTNAPLTLALINHDVIVNESGEVVDSQGNITAHSITPIFDVEKVAKEIQAQTNITQAFGQQAGQAVDTYVQTQRAALKNQLNNATTDAEKGQIKAQMDEVTAQERVMNILIGAVTGMGGTALTKEALSIAADEMRKLMIEDSQKFAGVTDGTTTLTNDASDLSDGVRGDGKKVGGTRIDLDKLCGIHNGRCVKNPDGSLKLNDHGQVLFDAKAAGISLSKFLDTPEGQAMAGATGGIQGWVGTLFGKPYKTGSWQDKLIEAFSGTHDFVGGALSGLYDEQGNATRGRSDELQTLHDTWSASGAIVISTPFAMAEFLPPQVWQAISILLKGAK